MSSSQIPHIVLNDGSLIPQIGLGVFGPDDLGAAAAVEIALQSGYRLIDTAEQYENELGVGEGIRRSGIPRGEVYLTTKFGHAAHGYQEATAAIERSLTRLGVDYIDLYLLHWPLTKLDKYVETWKAMEEFIEDGRVRSIGVANFREHHLERLMGETSVVPAVNQIELHPAHLQLQLREFNARHSITTMAWSPLGGNPFGHGNVLDNPIIESIALKYGKTPAQVIIRWHLDRNNVVIPKTVTSSRMKENIEVFDFSLSNDDAAALAGMEEGGPNPYDPDLFA
jgi:2,5-diketo-D-gluconate reductase A